MPAPALPNLLLVEGSEGLLRIEAPFLKAQRLTHYAPGALATRARELGMVQDSTPAFIDLAAGKIIGAPAPAKN